MAESQLERNKRIVRSFKECQGTKDQDATMAEIMSPDYFRIRGGFLNLGDNARGQGWPEPGLFMRKALPDRVDAIEDIVAEGEYVAMRWKLQATHSGNFFGIPATGRKIDIYEVGFFRVVEGKIFRGWFMCDELSLLLQLERQMPKRSDGKIVVPEVDTEGEGSNAAAERAIAQNVGRGFPQLQGQPDIAQAFTDCAARPLRTITDGDVAWSRFNVIGTESEISEVGIAKRSGNEWKATWHLGDGLGALLQLGRLDVLEKMGCKPV